MKEKETVVHSGSNHYDVAAAQALAAGMKGATPHDVELAKLEREWKQKDLEERQARQDAHMEKWGLWYAKILMVAGLALVGVASFVAVDYIKRG